MIRPFLVAGEIACAVGVCWLVTAACGGGGSAAPGTAGAGTGGAAAGSSSAQWLHVAMTWDGPNTTLRTYVNGALKTRAGGVPVATAVP